jgi:uncharacterized protein YegP (UPF0339 family)
MWVSASPAGIYFDVYHAESMQLTSLLWVGGDWRWRLCTENGKILAAGGGFADEAACMAAVDALRRNASCAGVRRVGPE